MMKTTTLAIFSAALLAGCSPGEPDNANGPAVSVAEGPVNQAVDTTPTSGETTQTPGANSFTEAQARGAMEGAGYTEIGALSQSEQGIWQGEGMKSGAKANISVDYKGTVTAR